MTKIERHVPHHEIEIGSETEEAELQKTKKN
jgi:hypothetical protein